MEIKKSNNTIYVRNRGRVTPVAELELEDETIIYILPGSRGQRPDCDILIKYKRKDKNIRTPKHVHWAVDLLIKKQFDEELTNCFIEEIKKEWDNCEPLKDNSYYTIKTISNESVEKIDVNKYKKLNKYGEYDVEFLIILLKLMMYMEKTNSDKAHMFIDVLNSLSNNELDIFSIISASTFNGGN